MNVGNEKHFRTGDAPGDPSGTGRQPGQRDPELTQRAILEAATTEFADKGFAGASVNEIAAAANVNKRMLYHYFGKKEDLYLLVLERAYAQLRAAQTQLDLSGKPPREAIASFVMFTWTYYINHPEMLRLFSGENIQRARYLRRSSRTPDLRKPLIAMLADILHQGEAAGMFRSGADPLQLYVTIASLTYFYLSACQTLSVLYGTDMDSAAALEARASHIVDVVLAFLRP